MLPLNQLSKLNYVELAPSHSNNVKRTELLGNYIQSLQKLHNLNEFDQYATEKKKPRAIRRGYRKTANTEQTEDAESGNEHNDELEEDVSTPQNSKTKSAKSPVPPPPKKVYKTVNYPINKIYAKDISCPQEYKDAIRNIVPEYLHPHGNNDLFALLPPRFKAVNLMCYLAQNKTGTPMHRDICATVGHNLMTMASPGGYAEWFIVVDEDREKLASVMKPSHQHDKETLDASTNRSATMSSFMESERGWLKRSHLKTNDLTVQVVLQQPGDLVIIPSRAYHQVRNIGVTVKVAWNRVTAQTLSNAFEDQLPLYQIVCRPEVFKCKAMVYYTLLEWNSQFEQLIDSNSKNIDDFTIMRYGRDKFLADSNILLDLYLYNVLYPEILSSADEKSVIVDIPDEFCTVKCDFCHADVFYHYYECEKCDNYDLCMKCYIAGRSCVHTKDMKMRRSDTDPSSLTDLYKNFIDNANQIYGETLFEDKSQFLER